MNGLDGLYFIIERHSTSCIKLYHANLASNNFGPPYVEACLRCEVLKASFTYIPANEACSRKFQEVRFFFIIKTQIL